MGRALAVPLAITVALGCHASTDTEGPDPGFTGLDTQMVAAGLTNPLYLTAPPGDPRLFVAEQPGRIRIVADESLLATPFLDITDRVLDGGERGLLSVAFHPNYATNGYFYVDYTDLSGDTRVERYRVSADPNLADQGSAKLILFVDQPYANHNGGLVLFGPDGMLYVGLGDGGSGGDPHGYGQNRGVLLGKVLRLDVDRGDPYAIPADNPFLGVSGARGEIWAYGLRNPWRFAFDREAGLLYIADVGQNRQEEVDVAPGSAGGLNYGWSVMEGDQCYGASTCDRSGLTLPVLTYARSGGNCSVIGGFAYRGEHMAALRGHFFYSDYCGGWVKSFRYDGSGAADQRDWGLRLGSVLSFGEDSAGELYALSADGKVYRLVGRSQ
ncbi:MAG: PQQ-dependent sugar dehydrogenase [Gemmatimonadetes bacterium]|nr:PQQ-dependent sugar dehydrogenase [Gemmatimonadota bacterium]